MVSTFQERVTRDLDRVFFNTERFARECSWNGKTIRVVISAAGSSAGPNTFEVPAGTGSNDEQMVVVLQRTEVPVAPIPDERVMFDREPWRCVRSSPAMGRWIIVLERWTQ